MHLIFTQWVWAGVCRGDKPVETTSCLFIMCSRDGAQLSAEVPTESGQNHELTALWEMFLLYLHHCLIQSGCFSVGVQWQRFIWMYAGSFIECPLLTIIKQPSVVDRNHLVCVITRLVFLVCFFKWRTKMRWYKFLNGQMTAHLAFDPSSPAPVWHLGTGSRFS